MPCERGLNCAYKVIPDIKQITHGHSPSDYFIREIRAKIWNGFVTKKRVVNEFNG